MKLWMGNIAPETTDEEVRAFLEKYGVPAVIAVERVASEGARPAAMVEIAAAPEAVNRLTQRLNGMYWKGRSLTVQAMTR